MNFIDIQSWFEVPSIAHFCSLFSSSFNLPDFDIEDLEEALLCDSSDNSIESEQLLFLRLVPELIVALLKGCDLIESSWPFITTSNYQMFLRRLFRKKCEEYNIDNPFNTDTDFQSLSLRTKVIILNYLCDFRLDSADVEIIIGNLEADSLRIEPLGYDNNGSAYWYFFGTRLYREDYRKGNPKSTIWQVICFTEEDWINLANKFKNSKSRKESALYKTLTENFLPTIPSLFKAKEQERRRRLLQRRTSNRIKALDERRKELNGKESTTSSATEEETEEQATKSRNETLLEERKKELEEINSNREKIKNERALRAQRRSRSTSITSVRSTYAGSDANSYDCFLIHREDFTTDYYPDLNQDEEQESLDKENFDDKENIDSEKSATKNRKKRARKRHSESENLITVGKMAPTTTKLPGRQTNNSLSSITGQIIIQTPPPTPQSVPSSSSAPSTSRKKKTKTEVFTETDEVLQIGMHKVLEFVKNHDDAWPFMDPVDEDIAPRYYSIIRRPMDLEKMEEKLDCGLYKTFTEFHNDFKLIVNNCRLYNGQNNEYTEMVNNLQIAFEQARKKYFDQDSSDEENNLGYPDTKLSVFKEKSISSAGSSSKENKKVKTKEKKSSKNNSRKDEDSSDDETIEKDNKKKTNSQSSEEKKSATKQNSANKSTDKEKNIEIKGVKRKRKEKDKEKDKSKHKKMKADYSDDDDEMLGRTHKFSESDGQESEVFEDSDIEETKNKKLTKKSPQEKIKKKKTEERHSSSSPSPSRKPEKKGKSDAKTTKIEKPKGKHKKQITPPSSPSVSRSPSPALSRSSSPAKNKKTPQKNQKAKGKGKEMVKPEKSEKPEKPEKPIKAQKESKKHESKKEKHEKHTKNAKKEKAKKVEDVASDVDEPDNFKTPAKRDVSSDGSEIEQPVKKHNKKAKESVEKEKKGTKKEVKAAKPEKVEAANKKEKKPKESKKKEKSKKNDKSRDNSLNNFKTKSASTPIKKPSKQEDDLMSVSSQSFSRSPSPLPSFHSSTMISDDLNNSMDFDNDSSKTPKKTDSWSTTDFNEIKDKFDLIKERRRGKNNLAEQQKQEEPKKSKTTTTTTTTTATAKSSESKPDKNQKLKETIEKLKMNNEKRKKDSELMSEILGITPPKIRDEKTMFDKLRATYGDKDAKTPTKPVKDHYNFSDDEETTPPPSNHPAKGKKSESQKVETSVEKHQSPAAKKAKQMKSPKEKKEKKTEKVKDKKSTNNATKLTNTNKKQNKASLEALELETEQTLKDINKWLEHTPKFGEFGSASNSPSRYMDEFDVLPVTKIDENDFKKPSLPLMPSSTNSSTSSLVLPSPTVPTVPSPLSSPGATSSSNPQPTNKDFNLLKESNNNKQSVPALNSSVPTSVSTHPSKKDNKDPKRKSLKDKLIQLPRKKEIQRTIDRLQPGKSKGNLLMNIQNINKPEELFPLGNPNRVKEIKNSLIVKTDESGPKLSLGTVLDAEGFGLVQQHNFNDDEKEKIEDPETTEKTEKDETKDVPLAAVSKTDETEKKKEKTEESKDAKVDVGAWFKAFGVSKKPKKPEEESPLKVDGSSDAIGDSTKIGDSPNHGLPGVQRQRRLSTGSTISERSSFSQDPDSPRIAIDERIGAPAPYPSPIGASPIMASPKTDDLQKIPGPGATPTYPVNGSIRVGFYQDMISTKSSPEKSCSPREMPSPYPQYTHMYSQSGSSSSPNVYWSNQPGGTTPEMPSKTPTYSKQTASPASYYDQYKQPMSQESDFNSSMSPTTNPNSPYHSQQSSPYQQQPNSPYQQTFQQQQQANKSNINSGSSASNAGSSTGATQQQPQQQPHSPYSQPNSPYQQPQSLQQQQQQQQIMNDKLLQPSQIPPPTQKQVPQQTQNTQQQPKQQHTSPNSPFSNESSPYSAHDPNSPYSHSQMSPFGQNVSPSNQQGQQSQANGNQQNVAVMNQTKMGNIPPTVGQEWSNKMNQGFPQNLTQNSQQQIASQVPQQSKHPVPNQQIGGNPQQMNQMQMQPNNNNANYQNPLNYQKKPDIMPPTTSNNPNQESPLFGANLKTQQRNMPEMVNLGYSGADTTKAGESVAQKPPVTTTPSTADLSVNKAQLDSSKFLDLSKQHPNNQQQNQGPINQIQAHSQQPQHSNQANHANNQQQRTPQQQQMFDLMNYGKNPLDFGNMFNRAPTMGFPGTSKNSNNLPPSGSSSCSVPNSNMYGKMDTTGNNEYLGNKNLPYLLQPNSGNQKLTDLSKSSVQTSGNNYNMHHGKMNTTAEQQATSKTNTELNIPRFDSPSGNMDLNSYKNKNPAAAPFGNPYDFLNIASLMRDERFLGIPGAAPGSYYDKNITPAHMLSKNLQQVNSTAALQQMFNSSMTTMAYNTNRDQANMNMNYQNRMPPSQAPTTLNSVQSSNASNPSVAQLVAATKDTKQKKPRKSKNPTPTLPVSDTTANPQMHPHPQSANNSAKTTAGNAAQDWSNKMNPSFPQNLVQPGGQQPTAQQLAAQQQGFQSYMKSSTSVQGSSTEAISLKTTSVVPGSAFNFGPGPGLPIPPGIYNPESSSYLEDTRGTENPYYPSSFGLRSSRETTDSRGIPGNPYYQSNFGLGSTPKTADKNAQPPPAHPPPAASPYHQFLSHPSRPSYPFMNPIDPIYQQHFQRQEELNQMQMINQTYQAGYHLSMHNRPPWM